MESYSLRNVVSLDGLWDFQSLGDVDVESFGAGTEACSGLMIVPGAFDALPAHGGRRGLAVYRRLINVRAGCRARIHFGAVSIWCRVLIDGTPVGDHACGYAPFYRDVPPSENSIRELTVLVDNRFDTQRAPMHEVYSDFYQYGGIIRGVMLHQFAPSQQFIDRLEVTPSVLGYREGEIEVAVSIDGGLAGAGDLTFQFDQSLTIPCSEIPGSDGVVRVTLKVPDPKIWSPRTPHLHQLRVVLHQNGTPRRRYGNVLRLENDQS
jgi:beta-glucuronidase